MNDNRIIQNQQFTGGHAGLSVLAVPLPLNTGVVIELAEVGGLHHRYERQAA
jgi:hypothetical protein